MTLSGRSWWAAVATATVLAMPAPAVATTATPTPKPSASASATPDPLAVAPSALTQLTTLALQYESSVKVAEDKRAESEQKADDAARALQRADAYVAQVIDFAMSPSGDPFAQKLAALAAAENPADLISGVYSMDQITSAQEARLADAKRAFDQSQRLQRAADRAAAAATKAEKTSERQLAQLGTLADSLGFGASNTPANLPATRTEQEAMNADVAERWFAYKRSLADTQVTPPAARSLRRPSALPAGLSAATTAKGEKIAGVATAVVGSRTYTILPAETMAMVDAVVERIGDGYAPKNGAGRWSCGGLVAVDEGFGLSGTPAALYSSTVRVPQASIQIGDLVFLADDASGIHHVGVYVGEGQMIDAPATRHQVGVSAVPDEVFAVTRPSLGRGSNIAPRGTAQKAPTICGATEVASAASADWLFPMKRGTYAISAQFGQTSRLWQTVHTGQDLAAPIGTPIYASRSGTVSLQEVGWAGTLITVSHPDGTAERYAHTSRQLVEDGQQVKAGDEIALVGARGNVTGPHLHFEITQNGTPVDPMPLLVQNLAGIGGGTSWGGFGNGQIPQSLLCPVDTEAALRCDVAADVDRLRKAFAEKFGTELVITGGYRDLVAQIRVGTDGRLVDLPGTSPFGWGTRFTTTDLTKAERQWMSTKAASFGLTSAGAAEWASTAR